MTASPELDPNGLIGDATANLELIENGLHRFGQMAISNTAVELGQTDAAAQKTTTTNELEKPGETLRPLRFSREEILQWVSINPDHPTRTGYVIRRLSNDQLLSDVDYQEVMATIKQMQDEGLIIYLGDGWMYQSKGIKMDDHGNHLNPTYQDRPDLAPIPLATSPDIISRATAGTEADIYDGYNIPLENVLDAISGNPEAPDKMRDISRVLFHNHILDDDEFGALKEKVQELCRMGVVKRQDQSRYYRIGDKVISDSEIPNGSPRLSPYQLERQIRELHRAPGFKDPQRGRHIPSKDLKAFNRGRARRRAPN